MTLQKSSFNPFRISFLSALKGNFIFPFLNLTALTILVPVVSAVFFDEVSDQNPYSIGSTGTAASFTDFFRYSVFFWEDEVAINASIHVSVFVFSVLLGVMMFRFITSKKKVNVYYSLGITRKSLFVSNYFAGILMLAVSIIVPFIAGIIINIPSFVSIFGSSAALWSAGIYYILGYCTLSFIAFSLTAAVFSCVGTIIEGVTFPVVILFGQTIFLYSVQNLMKKLTLGSPFGFFRDLFGSEAYNDIALVLSRFNPLLFLTKNLVTIGNVSSSSNDYNYVWAMPDFGDLIVWFIITAALFVVGMKLFEKRKPEISGFIGANKWLNFGVTFLVCFYFFSDAVKNINSILAGIAAGLLIFSILYLIADFLLTLNRKKWKKGFIKLPVHLSISVLLIIVFATGFFGFSSRIPDLESIESAEISPIACAGVSTYFSAERYDEDFLYSSSIRPPLDGYKTSDDLTLITGIHKLFIDAGRMTLSKAGTDEPVDKQTINTSVKIVYHLKNGRTINRYYYRTNMDIMTAMLKLDETDRYKEYLNQYLIGPAPDNVRAMPFPDDVIIEEETLIVPNRLNVSTGAALSDDNWKELKIAIESDLTAQTIEERYFPKTPALGVIEHNFNIIEPDKEQNSDQDPDAYKQFSINSGYYSTSFVVTKDMTNTLNFLEKNNLIKLFENDPGSEFIAAHVVPVSMPKTDYTDYYGDRTSFQFLGGWKNRDNRYSSFTDAYRTTDKTLIDEIAANAHISYFNNGNGYFVRFEMINNGGYTTMYVPAGQMPQSVIDGMAGYAKG